MFKGNRKMFNIHILWLMQHKQEDIPIPSRIERFGLMISLELTSNISPIYRWFVGTKTLHNSSSSLSLCIKNQQKKKEISNL